MRKDVRQEVLKVFKDIGNNKKIRNIRESFERKGRLSKRELKILMSYKDMKEKIHGV